MTAEGTRQLRRADGSPLVILIVDDHFDTCALVSEHLTRQGARAIAVREVPAALLVISTMRVDVILTDLAMPEMDGLTFLRTLRDDPAHRRTPVLMVTGHAGRLGLDAAAERLGASIVPKPFELATLTACVRHAVKRARAPSIPRAAAARASTTHARPSPGSLARVSQEAIAASELLVEASRVTVEASRRTSRRGRR